MPLGPLAMSADENFGHLVMALLLAALAVGVWRQRTRRPTPAGGVVAEMTGRLERMNRGRSRDG